MYPVAASDLHTFFEDVETWSRAARESDSLKTQRKALDSDVEARLKALNYDFPQGEGATWASIVYFRIGCLVSTVTYLHEQKIRHKDLKPSNILFSPDRLWLSDFGSATDFTLLSQSATDNERGTPRYFAPDGYVLARLYYSQDPVNTRRGSLNLLREHREVKPAFHANFIHLETWLETDCKKISGRQYYFGSVINLMLSPDPERRPTASELLRGLTAHDSSHKKKFRRSVFSNCCRRTLVLQHVLEEMTQDMEGKVESTEKLAKQLHESNKQQLHLCEEREKELRTLQRRLEQQQRIIEEAEQMRERYEECLRENQKAYRTLETQKAKEIAELRGQVAVLSDQDKTEKRTSGREVANVSRTIAQAASQLGQRSLERLDRPGQAAPPSGWNVKAEVPHMKKIERITLLETCKGMSFGSRSKDAE